MIIPPHTHVTLQAWNALSGSLMFCRSVAPSGVTTIAVHTTGVISGHMDGSLHLIGHSGIPQHSIRAHRKPISVMRCTGDRVVTGGYDAAVKVHRIPDFFCVNSVFIHNGGITALAVVEVSSYFWSSPHPPTFTHAPSPLLSTHAPLAH